MTTPMLKQIIVVPTDDELLASLNDDATAALLFDDGMDFQDTLIEEL